MADDLVQLEDGEWMRIDRRLWDALNRYKFNELELVVIKKVIRWTYGCVKQRDEDADKDQGRYCIVGKLEEAAAAMGLHHPALTRTLQALQEKQVIYAMLNSRPKVIVFNKYWPSWKVPLRSKYREKADSDLLTRNLNYSAVDEALGEEAFRQMKVAYQIVKELNDSLRKPYQIVKELNESLRKNDQKLNDSLRKNPVDTNKINDSQPLKDNIIKDNNNYDHNSITTDLTIIQGAILQKWGKQIKLVPPVAQIMSAIQEHGKQKLLEAINRMPVILTEAKPNTLMRFIDKTARNPTWYRAAETKTNELSSDQELADAQRVYDAIAQDDSADRDDPSYQQALQDAKQRLERAKEEHDAERNGRSD